MLIFISDKIFMKPLRRVCLSIFLAISFLSCKKNDTKPASNFSILSEKVQLNPFGNSPLAAAISIETSIQTSISIRVAGNHGSGSDVNNNFTNLNTIHTIPVLGLYAGYANTVELTFKDDNNNQLGTKIYTITTDPITSNFPQISINFSTPGMMAEAMTFVSYFGYKANPFPQAPFVFDGYGDIRWYANFTSSPDLKNLFYDDGME